ncbi:uncharacterized protein LOC106064379 isoform X1 [Biomphalaria glabrata]|uniref:Uncharacterized protein LOC106064379 isoform X1 n=2 Tax=Biomphalaria glabrata TaxID=6526 RepID=A0A9W3ADL7_BIOGL|nr:uncharacterized protein LOC106064379 isoform X1 [Biomphalaria glabrata]
MFGKMQTSQQQHVPASVYSEFRTDGLSKLDTDNNDEIKSNGRINWNQFRSACALIPVPVKNEHEIFLQHKVENEFTVFRKIAYKVTGRHYDIPQGHCAIIAYSKSPDPSEPAVAIGAISYWIATKETSRSHHHSDHFMNDCFHKISFLFVEKIHQRKGVGRRLVNEAIHEMKNSGINQPIHLEGAKSALKFFKKIGFVSCSKLRRDVAYHHSIFNNCVNMYYAL